MCPELVRWMRRSGVNDETARLQTMRTEAEIKKKKEKKKKAEENSERKVGKGRRKVMYGMCVCV